MIGKSIPSLVSVIVASYNHAEYLVQRMDSLINQTYQNIEIIVIDDCSTDLSFDILGMYEVDPRVRLVRRQKNGGWVAVSNQGVELSSGEFIIFANCDDGCDLRMIERLVDCLHVNPSAGIAYCRSQMINEEGQLIGDDFSVREKSFKAKCNEDVLISKEEMSRFLLHSCVIPNLSAALFRRECYFESGGLNSTYRVCADWDLFFRIACSYDVAYLAMPLNKFRQHRTTIRSSIKEQILYEEILGLLLSQISIIPLRVVERIICKWRVMYLWASHILHPPFGGLFSVAYLTKVVLHFDPGALVYLPFASLVSIVKLPLVVGKRIHSKLVSVRDHYVG